MHLHVALVSEFSCPDNERLNFRSQQLVVVFPLKANLLALTIFKQTLLISRWFYNSTVKYLLAALENEVAVKLMNG